jgi:hypothetical protein
MRLYWTPGAWQWAVGHRGREGGLVGLGGGTNRWLVAGALGIFGLAAVTIGRAAA